MSLPHRVTADVVAQAARPLVLSGDCPTSRAAVAELQRRHSDLTVPTATSTTPPSRRGYIGGMALAMLTGRTTGLSDDTLGLRPVPDTSVVFADARDPDPVDVHLDSDVIDGAQLPGARFPSGPGPSLERIEGCLAAAGAWLPEHADDQSSRRTSTRLAAALGADLMWHEPAEN